MVKALLIFSLSFGVNTYAQDTPSTTQKVLEAAAISAIGVDAWATNRNMDRPGGIEHDPITRPFVTHGTALRVISSSVSATTFYFADRKLSRNHPKLARISELSILGIEGWAAWYSIREYRRVR